MDPQLELNNRKAKIRDIREEFQTYDREETTEVRLEIDKHIARIVLNNPKRLNSLTGKMMSDFESVLDKLEEKVSNKDSTLIGVIIEGEGKKSFCAGFDLDLAQNKLQSSESGERLCLLMQDVTERLRNLPLISVCAIEGYALGGGAELATMSDFRIASENSVVRFLHRDIGTVPGWGGATRLYEILGYSDALYHLTTTKKIEIPRIGQSNRFFRLVCPPGKANEEARKFLNPFISDSLVPQVSRNIKSLISGLRTSDTLETKLDLESASFTKQWGSKINREAIKIARAKKGKK